MGVQRLGVSTPSTNTDTLLYTADYPFLASVIGTNLTTSTSLIDVWVVPIGVTLSSGYVYYAYQTDIPPSNTLETHKFALNIGDKVYVRSTQNTSFNISGLRQVDIQLATGVTSFQNTAPANPINGQVWVDGDGVAGTNISSLAGYTNQASSATQVPYTVKGASGQTANLQEWQDSSGTALAKVDSTGLMYSQQSPVINRDGFNVAGKNAIINGGMDIWQRGVSFATSAALGAPAFTADRMHVYRGTGASGVTTTRQSAGLTGFNYCARIQRNSGDTDTNIVALRHTIETAESLRFAGQVSTFSFYARKGANFSQAASSITVNFAYGTGTDQPVYSFTNWAQVTGSATVVTLTSGWQRYTITGTIPSSATELGFELYFSPSGTAGSADYFEITGMQLEIGSSATPFSRAGGNIQGETAACQRYYYRITGTDYTILALNAYTQSTTQGAYLTALPVAMRVAPTAVEFSNVEFRDTGGGGSAYVLGAITVASTLSSPAIARGGFTISSGSWTSIRSGFLEGASATCYIAFTAEL